MYTPPITLIRRGEFISVEDTAELLGVSVRTVQRLYAAGKLPGRRMRLSRRFYYERSEIETLMPAPATERSSG